MEIIIHREGGASNRWNWTELTKKQKVDSMSVESKLCFSIPCLFGCESELSTKGLTPPYMWRITTSKLEKFSLDNIVVRYFEKANFPDHWDHLIALLVFLNDHNVLERALSWQLSGLSQEESWLVSQSHFAFISGYLVSIFKGLDGLI